MAVAGRGMHTHALKFTASRDPVGEAAQVCVGRGTGGEEEEKMVRRDGQQKWENV